jgi:hypothetical protein
MRYSRLAGLVLSGLVGLATPGTASAQASGGQPPAGTAASPPGGQAAPATTATRTTWYFYKVRWGYQGEFLNLFQKNHYPLLKAQQELGRFVSIRTLVPTYHGDGRADWTFAVELVARDGVTGLPTEEELIRKLYPDEATFNREERRRFEILDAHWDVPLDGINFETRQLSGR